MDNAKTAMDTAKTASDDAKTDYDTEFAKIAPLQTTLDTKTTEAAEAREINLMTSTEELLWGKPAEGTTPAVEGLVDRMRKASKALNQAYVAQQAADKAINQN